MGWWGKCCCAVVFTIFGSAVFAQTQYGYRFTFTDKKGSLPLSNPKAFLSQRALDRRSAQSINVDTTDLPVSPLYIDTVLSVTGGKMHVTSHWMNQCVVLMNDTSNVNLLRSKPYISKADYMAVYSPGLHKTTQDNYGAIPLDNKTTGNYYGAAYDQTLLVNGNYLHDHGFRGDGKMIAVFDQGFSGLGSGRGFDTIRKKGRLIDVFNFRALTTSVDETSDHGTSCLSTMAGNIVDTFVGAAPNASYAAYITEIVPGEQQIEWDNMLAACERADSAGVDIISVSLGYNEITLPFYHQIVYNTELDGKTTLAAKAANIATMKGILFVASAGNDGDNAWHYILTPGDADSAITIGSVDGTKNIAYNSGYGPNSSGRLKPDVCMFGAPAHYLKDGTNVYQSSATSFATPQLAGWAACLWQSKPNATPFMIKDAIIRSAHLYTTPNTHDGYGVPDFKLALEYLGVKTPDVPASNSWVTLQANPINNQEVKLKISLPSSSNIDICMTSISGQVVYKLNSFYTRSGSNLNFSIPALAAGEYFIHVVANDRQTTLKALIK